MADNVALNPGTGGDTIAADDIGGVKYQRIKLALGNDGANDGDVSDANPMPVTGSIDIANFPVAVLPQVLDTGNTIVVNDTVASPGSPWIGAWYPTRANSIIRQLVVLASNVTAGLGGIFTFEFGEDGSTATISEERNINDFSTVRDFDLINAGAYFRVKFEPSVALGPLDVVYITTTQRRIYDGQFVRLANQEIEEANAAMGQTFAYLKVFDRQSGKSVNIRPSVTGALRTNDDSLETSHAGGLFVEGIRDDISLNFSSGTHLNGLGGIVDDGSVDGTATFDAVHGRVVFSVPAAAGKSAVFRSLKPAVYEPGHMIRGEQTVELSALPTGNGYVEWGYGDANNGIGWRVTASGIRVFRRKNGVIEHEVPQANWNQDTLTGQTQSFFRFNEEPQALDILKNNLYLQKFEWLGVDTPEWQVKSPTKEFVTVHVEQFPNNNTGTTIPSPSLPLYVAIHNDTVSGQALSVACGSWRGGIQTNAATSSAQQPDGDWVSERASGLAKDRDGVDFYTTSVLGAGATYTSGWMDSDGWDGLEINIACAVPSALGGLLIQYTDDVSAAVPIVRAVEMLAFDASDAAVGHAVYRYPTRMDGFRVLYTNGATAQSSFFLEVDMRRYWVDNVREVPISDTITTTPLLANGSFVSQIVNVTQHPSVVLLFAANVASSVSGILLQWSDTADFSNVRRSEMHSFRAADVSSGLTIDAQAVSNYFRITYLNGPADQTRFYIGLRLNPVPLQRNVNPIPSAHGQTGQLTVGITSDRVAPGPLPNRSSIRLKNLSSSARPLFYGFTSGVTTANGDELSVGESIELDLDEFVELWVITTSTAGAGVRCSWTEVG